MNNATGGVRLSPSFTQPEREGLGGNCCDLEEVSPFKKNKARNVIL